MATSECCICFEEIGQKNNCVTPCGHAFCFECMMKALAKNSSCPYCRTKLIAEDPVENKDNDDEYSNDDDDTQSELSYADAYVEGNLLRYPRKYFASKFATSDEISRKLSEKGYIMSDIVMWWTDSVDYSNERYRNGFIKKFIKDFDDIIVSCNKEAKARFDERLQFEKEDIRSNNMRQNVSALDGTDEEDYFAAIFS